MQIKTAYNKSFEISASVAWHISMSDEWISHLSLPLDWWEKSVQGEMLFPALHCAHSAAGPTDNLTRNTVTRSLVLTY